MLHEIGLKNFKAFGTHLQKAPLSKISLIYGPNSGGKSSIIQALLLLKQSRSDDRLAFARAEEPTGRLRPRGEYVDLGGYGALIHKHDTSQSLGISLAYEGQGVSRDPRYASGLFTTQRITSNMSFSSPHPNSQTDFTGLEYKIMHSDRTLFDGKWESSIGHDGDRTMASRLSIGGVDIHPDLIAISDNGFLPYLYVPGLTPEGGRNWEQATSDPALIDLLTNLEETLGPNLLNILRSTHSGHSYDNLLDSIVYLGPLRSNPERIYTVQRMDRSSTGVRGEFTHELLSSNSRFVQLANSWFNSFEIPYIMTVDNFGVADVTGEYISIGLVDKRTNTKVTLADVGFGINQILPIIVEALTTSPRHSIFSPLSTVVCVEQPEIHLHPKLQAAIADLMIATSLGPRGKQWIIETHSELLMRRIQRRIGEGKITAQDVSVIYVDPKEYTGSTIQLLRLDENGDFVDDWPSGFFEEGYDEMMAY